MDPTMTPTDSPSRRFTIAVIGPSGTGKSTFIKHLTSDPTIYISTSLVPCTTRVSAHPIPNSPITLLDTPAVDSSAPHLLASLRPFTADELPDSIIYLHPINDIQVCGEHLRDLCWLQTLVPAGLLVVATSLWDDDADGPEYQEQVRREEKLLVQPELFLPLMEKGAMYERFYGSLESAGRIIARFKMRETGREEVRPEQELESASESQAEEILAMNGSQNESESPPTNPIAVTMATSTPEDTAAPVIPATLAGEEVMARRNSATILEETIADPPPPYTPYPTAHVLQNTQYNAPPPGPLLSQRAQSSFRTLNGHVYCVSSNTWRPVAPRRHGPVNIAPNGQHTALPLPPTPPLPPRPPTNSMDGAQEHRSPMPWSPASSSTGPAPPQYHSPQAPPATAHQPFPPQPPIATQRRACIVIKRSGTFRAAKPAFPLLNPKRMQNTPNIHPAPFRPSLRVQPVPVESAGSPYPQENGIYRSNNAAAPYTGSGPFGTPQYHSQSTVEQPHSAYSPTQMMGALPSPPVNNSPLDPASNFPSSPPATSNNFVGHGHFA